MDSISKNIIFYITIVESESTDHSFLRKVVHTVLPQAIVESVHTDDESIRYFNNCTIIPHLIFLDQDMLRVSGKNTIDLIKRVYGLNNTPIVFLSSASKKSQRTNLDKLSVNHFYAKPYKAQDLLAIVSSLNTKWVA
jgi:CheY-like chemotaxis protein